VGCGVGGLGFRLGVLGLGLGAWNMGYRVRGLGFGVWGLGFVIGVWGGWGVRGFGVWVLRCEVLRSGVGVLGFGFGVLGSEGLRFQVSGVRFWLRVHPLVELNAERRARVVVHAPLRLRFPAAPPTVEGFGLRVGGSGFLFFFCLPFKASLRLRFPAAPPVRFKDLG